MHVLHQGQGVHYGMFPGGPLPGHVNTVWNIIRPHNWRPATDAEYLVQLDADTGVELQRVLIPSRFSHDAIRMGPFVYVCSTGDGSILQLSYPSMTLVQVLPLFTTKDHPNTLAAASADGNHLWIMLHNLGESDLVKVYVGPNGPAKEVSRLQHVGRKAHGLVSWGRELILLDSDRAVLVSLAPDTSDAYELWGVPEEGKFLKGLAVVDDIAYFGITTWADRSVRDNPNTDGELAAFDLVHNRLLWRRVVATAGLLNVIGAPHLAIDSTFTATYSRSRMPAPVVLPNSQAVVSAAVRRLRKQGAILSPINAASYWSSGWPRLDVQPKLTKYPEDAGLQLPLFWANVTALQARLLQIPDAMWTQDVQAVQNVVMTGRTSNMERFKPGVEGMVLVFSDNLGQVVYEFPFYEVFRTELEPLLLEVLGPRDTANIIRVQLARMQPGTSDIKMHQDSGGYAKLGHRIHIPIITHPDVVFSVCPTPPPHPDATAEAAAAAAPSAGVEIDTSGIEDDFDSSGASVPMPMPNEQLLQSGVEAGVISDRSIDQQHGHLLQQPGHPAAEESSTCITIPAHEGLVFELNNRVPHKVANPGPGVRVHLVIDVFEEPKTRTQLPPGSVCEYGSSALLMRHLAKLVEEAAEEDALAAQIQRLLGTAGMICSNKEGQYVFPKLPPSTTPQAEQAGQELLSMLTDVMEQHGGGQQVDLQALIDALQSEQQLLALNRVQKQAQQPSPDQLPDDEY
eukprot:gene13388-13515_t